MSQYYFYLSLNSIDSNEIEDSILQNILGVSVENGIIECPADIVFETDQLINYYELKWLLDLIQSHIDELLNAGVSFESSQIWMNYGYFNQCNMQFDSLILKRIGDLGLTMCVSCYEDKNLSNRESFKSETISRNEEGIYLSVTTGIDNKLDQIFPIVVNIENERSNDSFVLTSIDLDNNFLRNFDIVKYEPEPKYIEHIKDYTLHYYDKIVSVTQSVKISIFLKPKDIGIFRGNILVCEGGQYIERTIVAVIE